MNPEMPYWLSEEKRRYDYLYSRGYSSGNPELLVRHFDIRPESKVLDIGCGNATLRYYFEDYTGVDISGVKIEELKNDGGPGTFYEGDFQTAIFIDDDFDVVICNDVLEHLPPWRVGMAISDLALFENSLIVASICCRKAGTRDQDGLQVHRTVKPPPWWRKHWEVWLTVEAWDEAKNQNIFVKGRTREAE